MTHRAPPQLGTLATFHLLGTCAWDDAWALQTRLAYEAGERDDDRIVILLCEHPLHVTVGRSGSREHVRFSPRQLRREQLSVQWVSRGGGCVLHHPGQLAIYPIVPLGAKQWTVGEYLRRLKAGLRGTLAALRIPTDEADPRPGLWGRTGQLASVGIAARGGIALHGAWLHVQATSHLTSLVDVVAPELYAAQGKTTAGAILAERREVVTMPQVKAAVIESLSAALGCDRQHVHTGHPLAPAARVSLDRAAR